MTLIGVTGTNGKTTTTYLLKAMLERALGAKVGLIGTNQNLIGARELPARTAPRRSPMRSRSCSGEMADAGCTHVVMEVSSHALCPEPGGRRLHLPGGDLHQPDPGPSGLPRDHGGLPARPRGCCSASAEHAVLNLDDEAGRWLPGADRLPRP